MSECITWLCVIMHASGLTAIDMTSLPNSRSERRLILNESLILLNVECAMLVNTSVMNICRTTFKSSLVLDWLIEKYQFGGPCKRSIPSSWTKSGTDWNCLTFFWYFRSYQVATVQFLTSKPNFTSTVLVISHESNLFSVCITSISSRYMC